MIDAEDKGAIVCDMYGCGIRVYPLNLAAYEYWEVRGTGMHLCPGCTARWIEYLDR